MHTRIIIIEDLPTIREGLSKVLDSVVKYHVVNAYATCEDALEYLEADRPDIVLMDIQLPGMSGIVGTRQIKQILPECIVLIITVLEDEKKVFQSLSAGASGYIIKSDNLESIMQTIDTALAGGAPMSHSIGRMVVEYFQRQSDSPLSERETEVLQCVAEGKSYSRIAEELCISPETVRSHNRNIYRKLEVTSKADALKIAGSKRWINRPI